MCVCECVSVCVCTTVNINMQNFSLISYLSILSTNMYTYILMCERTVIYMFICIQ